MLDRGLFPWVTDGEVSQLDKEENGREKGEDIPNREEYSHWTNGTREREA